MRLIPIPLTLNFVFVFITIPARAQWTNGTNISNTNTGNVGIGISVPATKLHVSNGHLAASSDDALNGFVQLWGDNAVIFKSGNGNGRLRFGSATNLGAANWSEKMCIRDDGKVGIGTDAPRAALHVVAPDQDPNSWAAIFEKPRLSNTGAFAYSFENVGGINANNVEAFWRGLHLAAPYITVGGQNTWPRLGFYAQYDSYTDPTIKKWVIRAANSTVPHDIEFMSDATSLLYLRSDGNVGIGTTAPGTFRLAVEGKVGARKVVVTQNAWADYVFDSTYVLRPLSQVERFIKTNKHLPDVPSAEEVKNHGLDIGDNQAILLKKIEELTLYIIELNKTVVKQQQEMQQLRTMVLQK